MNRASSKNKEMLLTLEYFLIKHEMSLNTFQTLILQFKKPPQKTILSVLPLLISFNFVLFPCAISIYFCQLFSPFSLPLHIHLPSTIPLLMPVSMSWRISGSVWTIAL